MVVDLTSLEVQKNPYPTYAEMRKSNEPIFIKNPNAVDNAYFISRYDDVLTVLTDPRFANDQRRLPNVKDWTKKWYVPKTLRIFADSMPLTDEPDHTRLRKLVHKVFTPKMIQDLESTIEQQVHNLLDAVAHKPEIDFQADFALPLPLSVISDMMGVSLHDRHKIHKWMSNTITDAVTSNLFEVIPKMFNAFGLSRFLEGLIADRRCNPKDDLTTALVQAEADGDKLSESELLAMLFIILFAGHETAVNLIASGTLALLQNPKQFDLLKENPDLMDSAIEELLRYTNPVQHAAMRYALEDVEIGGVFIPKSSIIMPGIAAANRDETVFENPDSLDITRKPNRHIAFGFGIHYCIGAPLARLETKIAFEILFRRYPNLELAVPGDQLEWKGAPALRGLKHLPMRLKN